MTRDLVTAACLLHDVGTVETLPEIAGTTIPDAASFADHITRGILLVRGTAAQLETDLPAKRLEQLTHALLAHHGRTEWGAPVEPHTVEAWLVHLADLAESRLWGYAHEELDP